MVKINIWLKEQNQIKLWKINHNWYQRGLASMIYKVFDKKSGSSGIKSFNNMKMNFINHLLENLTKEEFILHWKIIFGELI